MSGDWTDHLNRHDCPKALALLKSIIGGGTPAGWEPTAEGAWVDWQKLCDSYLSTTETAAVHVARAASIVERHGGGFPGHLMAALEDAINVGRRRG